MMTYFVLYMFVYETLIEDMLKDGEAMEKAISIITIPLFLVASLLFIILDIVALPIYILIGIFYLLFKASENK